MVLYLCLSSGDLNLFSKSFHIHIPTQSFTSPNTGLTYPITTLANCKSSNLVYQLQCKKCGAFYIGEMDQKNLEICKWAPVLLHGRELCSTGTHPHPIPSSSLSRNAGPSMSLTNSHPDYVQHQCEMAYQLVL